MEKSLWIGFDDLIANDEQPDKYDLWCCNLVIDKIVEYYKLHDNEGGVIYKKEDILIAVMAWLTIDLVIVYVQLWLYYSNDYRVFSDGFILFYNVF